MPWYVYLSPGFALLYVAIGLASLGYAHSKEPGIDAIAELGWLAFWPAAWLVAGLHTLAKLCYDYGHK